MSTLINILKKNHSNDLSNAMIPVKLKEYNSIDGLTLQKPEFKVLDYNNNRCIATHGKDYNLIEYYKIIAGLSEALENYGIKLNNVGIDFKVDTNLNYMRLRILFFNV